jgi:hypothetical protein
VARVLVKEVPSGIVKFFAITFKESRNRLLGVLLGEVV